MNAHKSVNLHIIQLIDRQIYSHLVMSKCLAPKCRESGVWRSSLGNGNLQV
jgi:hypothetical protein